MMASDSTAWARVPIVDLCAEHVDCVNRTAPAVDEPTPFKMIRTTNVRNGFIDTENVRYVTEETYKRWTRRLVPKRGDVILTREAPLGDTGKIRTDDHIFLGQRLYHFRPDPAKLDADFLLYALMAPDLQAQIKALGSGSTVEHMRLGDIPSLEIEVPALPIQRRIAGILSAYDDLIENNQRRIKILEEMARCLYREWFVHFRFPGHDKVKMVPSALGPIPQGWEVRRLDEACESVQDGDWIETKDQGGNDYRLLQISNIGVGEFVETSNFRFVTQETFDRLRCTEIKPGDILVARMPTPIGRAWRATEMPWRMITAVDVAIIRTSPHLLNSVFLAQSWNEQSNLQRIAGQASGTTRLRITRRELAALEFVVPSVALQGRFEDIVGPKASLATTLRTQNNNLRRTRDLLLPRLLSGQHTVGINGCA